jgi:hypothetical protein
MPVWAATQRTLQCVDPLSGLVCGAVVVKTCDASLNETRALLDYFSGGFDGPGEGLLLVHGLVSNALAPAFMKRMQRVAQDFAQAHQKLSEKDREGYTLLLCMRSWVFEAFAALRRPSA